MGDGETYPNQRRNKVQRQSIAQHSLNKDPENKDMDPNHNGLTPSRPAKAKGLAPNLALITTNTLNLFPLFFLAALHVLEVTGDPLILARLVHKFHAVLFERSHGVQGELVVRGD